MIFSLITEKHLNRHILRKSKNHLMNALKIKSKLCIDIQLTIRLKLLHNLKKKKLKY